MTIKKAIERITWRLGEGGWRHNGTDLEAVNAFIRFINFKNTEQIQNNELTAKLYILAFGNELKNKGASVFDDIIQKEFHKLFDRPLSSFIRDFQYNINAYEQYQILKKYGYSETHHLLASDQEDDSDLEALYKTFENESEQETALGRSFSYEEILNNLSTQFNQFIDDTVQGNSK